MDNVFDGDSIKLMCLAAQCLKNTTEKATVHVDCGKLSSLSVMCNDIFVLSYTSDKCLKDAEIGILKGLCWALKDYKQEWPDGHSKQDQINHIMGLLTGALLRNN